MSPETIEERQAGTLDILWVVLYSIVIFLLLATWADIPT
jgi:hypothetical protein